MKRYFLAASLLFTTPLITLAQSQNSDSLAHELVTRYRKVCAAKMSQPGYRVQIYFGADRSKAQDIRVDFMRNFSDVPAYMVYHQPNFKIRVGDFKTRLEAQGFLKKLENLYTTAFIVTDEVKLPVIN